VDAEAIYDSLERIASALEKLADILENRKITKKPKFDTSRYITARETSEKDERATSRSDLFLRKTTIVPSFADLMSRCGMKVLKTLGNSASKLQEDLAVFIGEHYEHLEKILKSIKRHMQNGEGFSVTLDRNHPEMVANSSKFCLMSQELNLIREYDYRLSFAKYSLYIKTSSSPEALNFFAGRWMEMYLVHVMKDVKTRFEKRYPGIEVDYINNLQVLVKNSLLAELDLAFRIDDKLFWAEAKSGEFVDDLEKFRELSQLIDVPSDRAVLVLADVDAQSAENLSKIYNITVVPLRHFKSFLEDHVKKAIKK